MSVVTFVTRPSLATYCVFHDGGNPPKPWNHLSSAYEAYNSANWTMTKYCVAAVEGMPRCYAATVPAGITAGKFVGYVQAGGSPVPGDVSVWEEDAFATTGLTAVQVDTLLSANHGAGDWSATDAGTGDTAVSSDTGGTDNLSYKTAGGAGIDGATVLAYLKSDYDAGDFTVRGRATTDSLGRWVAPIFLDSGGVYTLTYDLPGFFGVDTKDVTVP